MLEFLWGILSIASRSYVLCVPIPCLSFTWNQKPKAADGVLKKIDRIRANLEFQDIFIRARAIFQPYRISNHSPAVLKIPRSTTVIPKPFKFSNILIYNVRFKDVVKDGWDLPVSGFYMFQVVKKLKHMKKSFRKLLYDHGNLRDNVKYLQFELDKVQSDLDLDPSNNIIRKEEAAYVLAFNEALIMEERFLKQKAKIEWLHVGDSNSAYFHKAVKGRVSRSKIDVVSDSNGVLFEADQVPMAFVNHYAAFLRQQGVTSNLNTHNLFTKKLDSNVAFEMIKTVTNQEVKDTIFSIGNDKSPSPDGYTTAFIKKLGMLWLKELNYTIIALIPKIMECVTSTSFSLIINGVLHRYFKGQRGLCQGDPMSSYLFTLIMEILTLMLQRQVCEDDSFTYHRYCDKLDIINLWFADELFLFAYGDADSAQVIMGALDEFKLALGLTPSLPKSTAYFCNVLNHAKLSILNILPFEDGHLPIKYLGVPLISSRLIYRDCRELIEKASVFTLPSRVLLDIEQLMRGFLWCQWNMRRGKAKVVWEVVCLPKKKGGLGLRRLDIFNKALMVSHIWSLLSLKESLWVKWIHAYKLKGQNFWDVPIRGNMAWGWRKVLQIRPIIWEFIWYRIGDGSKVSVWFDHWCPIIPLSKIVSVCDIHRVGFDMSTMVWNHIKIYAGTPRVAASLNAIIDHIIPMSKKKTTRSVIAKLVFAASTYFIWQERNYRLFKNQKRSPNQIIDCIKITVRLKLLTCRFKKTKTKMSFMHLWKLPDSLIYHDPNG
ncbi:RNA-directed DNA polymerase, eukaryota, reverse transcriptase zinc-binding domain protein [Tanacetum coccineum]